MLDIARLPDGRGRPPARLTNPVGTLIGHLVGRLVATLTPARGDWQAPQGAQAEVAQEGAGASSAPDVQPSPAFDAFYTAHERPLYGYIRRLVATDDGALDIAQETFLRAWQHFDTIQSYDRPAAWLYRVATNLTMIHLRRYAPPSFSQLARSGRVEHDAGDVSDTDELLVDPTNFADASAERDLINALLRRLPERQRAALLLRAVQGFSCDEIAALLDLSPAAARQTLSRGRERFRALYEAASRRSDTPHPPTQFGYQR